MAESNPTTSPCGCHDWLPTDDPDALVCRWCKRTLDLLALLGGKAASS